MNMEVIVSYLPRYTEAFGLTVRTGVTGILIATVLGVICAFVMHFGVPFFSQAAGMYVVGLATTNAAEAIEPLCDKVISDYLDSTFL